jgi:hypothetical protein
LLPVPKTIKKSSFLLFILRLGNVALFSLLSTIPDEGISFFDVSLSTVFGGYTAITDQDL